VSYRVPQLAPQTSTRGAFPDRRSPIAEGAHQVRVLRTWVEDDTASTVDLTIHGAKINWSAVLGLVIVFGVSVGFWTGVVLVAKYIWR